MREQKTKAQVKKTNYDIIPNTHALYLYPHPDMNQPPTTTYAKSQDLLKVCGEFLVFASVIKRRQFTLQRATSIKAWI